MNRNQTLSAWLARLAVGSVFAINITCALAFILNPEGYVTGFEISGIPGRVAVQGFGILFLMWNVTYPPVMLNPNGQKTLFVIVMIQQAIGVAGETWLWLGLPAGHLGLRATGLRFILFDAAGLVLIGAAFFFLKRAHIQRA